MEDSWSIVNETGSQLSQQVKGFVAHLTEFWRLVTMLLRVTSLHHCSSRFIGTIPTDSVQDLHEFIR